MDFSGSPFSYTRSIPRQVVESRVESVQWQKDGRVHWWRRHIIISLKRGSQLTTHEERQVQYSIDKLCGIYQLLS